MDVSRETAIAAFGAQLDQAQGFARLLAQDGIVRGLLGPREADRLWSRHLVASAVLGQACPADGMVIDVGSGAGLPGIPLALARPDLTVHLVEPLLRRATFLCEVVATLGLRQVLVVRARGEDLHGRLTAQTVVARAVAPLPRLMETCMPLVSPGGALLAVKGSRAEEELAAASEQLDRFQVTADIPTYGAGLLAVPVRAVRLTRQGPVVASPTDEADNSCPPVR